VTKEVYVKHFGSLVIGFLGITLATSCAGKSERIDLNVPQASAVDEKVVAISSPTIAILPFEDNRTNRSHLGTRYHLWGGESHFSLASGTLSETTAEAFAEYLKRRGWNTSVAKGHEAVGVDMTITGKLEDIGVDVKSSIGQTTLNAKSRMVMQVKNHADGSQVRETLTSIGTNQVFWFDPEDAQELLNELYNKNFEKFVTDTRLEGNILKLR
jgi:hypothetical protein